MLSLAFSSSTNSCSLNHCSDSQEWFGIKVCEQTPCLYDEGAALNGWPIVIHHIPPLSALYHQVNLMHWRRIRRPRITFAHCRISCRLFGSHLTPQIYMRQLSN